MTKNKRLTACKNTCLFAVFRIEVLGVSRSLTGQRIVCRDYDVLILNQHCFYIELKKNIQRLVVGCHVPFQLVLMTWALGGLIRAIIFVPRNRDSIILQLYSTAVLVAKIVEKPRKL